MAGYNNNNSNNSSGHHVPDDGSNASNDDSYYDRLDKDAVFATDLSPYPYDKYFMRKEVYPGTQVYDCGNCLHLAGNRDEPVTKDQVKVMIIAAIRDKGWDTLYIFDKKGKPIPDFGKDVQEIIKEMRTKGELPEGCTIRAATTKAEYPKDTAAKFERWLRTQWLSGAFNAQAQADVAREMGQSGPGYDHAQGQTKAAAPAPV